jgi:hypothetical protein
MAHLSQYPFANEAKSPEEQLTKMDTDLDMLDHSEPPLVLPDVDMPDFSGRPSPVPAQPTATFVSGGTERRRSQSPSTILSRPLESLKLKDHAFMTRQKRGPDVPEQLEKDPAEFGTKVTSLEVV